MGEETRGNRWISCRLVIVGLLLLLAGCTAAGFGNNSDNEKNSGFYSGASGGWSHP
jgi:hypothetical protein